MDALDKQLLETTEQRGSEWHTHRLGKFTASEIWKLMTDPRSKSETMSQTAKTYVLEKVSERLTGQPCRVVDTKATEWGEFYEGEARAIFELLTGKNVQQVGFFPLGEDAGGSPDGLIEGEKSGIEIKCPYNSANHIDHMLIEDEEMLKSDFKEYYWQCQMNMACTGCSSWWFVSYDPRMPEGKKLFKMLVNRSEKDCHKLISRIADATLYLRSVVEKL